MAGFLIFGLAWEGFYSLNTNVLKEPLGRPFWCYFAERPGTLGFNKLELYLRDEIFGPLPELYFPDSLAELKISPQGRNLILVDATINWFGYMWYFEKYPFFYRLPALSFRNFLQSLPKDSNIFTSFELLGIGEVYYIFGADDSVLDSRSSKIDYIRHNMEVFAEKLRSKGVVPKEIKNNRGEVIFEIYHFEINQK